MLPTLREFVYCPQYLLHPQKHRYILAGDIGGTNSNFGIFSNNATQALILSLHFKSQDISDYTTVFVDLVAYITAKYALNISAACLGIAGIINQTRTIGKPTNLAYTIDAKQLSRAASITPLILINDFEALALGIDQIPTESIAKISSTEAQHTAQRACIGAGTGLGKAILVWSTTHACYLPVSSEGGHADFAVDSEEDYALCAFIKKQRNSNAPVSWEEILSGNGIKTIYQFLEAEKNYPETAISREIASHQFNPDRISAYAQQNAHCADVFSLYQKYYARCAKNFALESLARGGLYIGGGIASKNVPIFTAKAFLEEFNRCAKHQSLLASIPLFVITDYYVSLYGAMRFFELFEKNIVQ